MEGEGRGRGESDCLKGGGGRRDGGSRRGAHMTRLKVTRVIICAVVCSLGL